MNRDNATPPPGLPPMIPLPSVHDLVRRIRVLSDTADACPDDASARDWMDDQDSALRSLVATMPALTLADAAAQLYIATGVVSDMEVFELSEDDRARALTKLRRIMRSVFPVVAEAAGLELVALAGKQQAEWCEGEFPELAALSTCTGRAST
jgi:hypothetical protein